MRNHEIKQTWPVMALAFMFTIALTAVAVAGIGKTAEEHAPEESTWVHGDGPYGGSVWSVLVTRDGLILAGTLSHGAYFSAGEGLGWLQSNLTGVSVYGFARGARETVFAATQNGVYRSDDNGRNWTLASEGMKERRVQTVLVHESGRVLAATLGGGIYISDDQGASWQEANEGLPLKFAYALGAHQDGSIVAGVTNRIYRSTDGGKSWNETRTDFPHVRSHAIVGNEDGWLFAATDEGVYYSEDAGNTWKESGNQFAGSVVYDLAVTSDNRIFAATREGIYVSSDAGATWEPDGLDNQPVYAVDYGSGRVVAGANPGVFYRK